MKINTKKPVSIYQFKITLNHVTPLIWRRFQVRSDITLHRLSTTILLVMDWDGGHLHQFRIQGIDYAIPHEDYEEDNMPEDEREIILRDMPQGDLNGFIYEYDFGDGWEHDVVFEGALEPEARAFYPRCIAGARNSPPEDCGGIGGYYDLAEKLKKPEVVGEEISPVKSIFQE